MKLLFSIFLFFISLSIHANDDFGIRTKNARMALSMFDSIETEKMVYSISDSLYFIIINRDNDNEYFVKFSSDSLVLKKTSVEDYLKGKHKSRMEKLLLKSQPIFSKSRYYHGIITWCPSDSSLCPHSSINHFLYVDEKGRRILEFETHSEQSGLIGDIEIYMLLRTCDEYYGWSY